MLAVILSISQFTYVWFQSPHIHSSLTLIRGTNCHQPSVLFAIGLTCLFFIEIIINNNKTSEVKFSMRCLFKICFRFWIQTRWSSESQNCHFDWQEVTDIYVEMLQLDNTLSFWFSNIFSDSPWGFCLHFLFKFFSISHLPTTNYFLNRSVSIFVVLFLINY